MVSCCCPRMPCSHSFIVQRTWVDGRLAHAQHKAIVASKEVCGVQLLRDLPVCSVKTSWNSPSLWLPALCRPKSLQDASVLSHFAHVLPENSLRCHCEQESHAVRITGPEGRTGALGRACVSACPRGGQDGPGSFFISPFKLWVPCLLEPSPSEKDRALLNQGCGYSGRHQYNIWLSSESPKL